MMDGLSLRWRWRREGRTDSVGGLAVGRRWWTVVGWTGVVVRTGRTKVKSGVLST